MNPKILLPAVCVMALLGGAAGGFIVSKTVVPAEPEMGAAVEEEAMPVETLYYPMTPEFIINFTQPSDTNFLMLDVTVSTDDLGVFEVLEKHNPELRNDLLLMFSQHANDELFDGQGKEKLRTMASEIVTEIVKKHYPEGEVKDLYFTRLVMQ